MYPASFKPVLTIASAVSVRMSAVTAQWYRFHYGPHRTAVSDCVGGSQQRQQELTVLKPMGGVFAGPSASPQCLPAASPLGSDAMATATARGASRRAAIVVDEKKLKDGTPPRLT